jgi:hypothetical protein
LYFLVLGYDPFAASRIFIQRLFEEKRILDPAPTVATAIDDQGYARAIAWVRVTEELTVLGHARCLFFMTRLIPSVGAHSLAEELAIVDAAEKLKRYCRGDYQPVNNEEMHEWHDRFYQWGSLELR